MAARKGTKRKRFFTRKPRRGPGARPARGARRLLASAQTASGGPPQAPEMYMPSDPADDGGAAAGLLAFYATGDALEASAAKPWPEWVATLLERKLAERLASVQGHADPKWKARVASAQAHVAKWKATKP